MVSFKLLKVVSISVEVNLKSILENNDVYKPSFNFFYVLKIENKVKLVFLEVKFIINY